MEVAGDKGQTPTLTYCKLYQRGRLKGTADAMPVVIP